jgi:hypothetical protein
MGMGDEGAASRVILDGVPRIGYDVHLCPFPGALHAYLRYVGNPQPYDYMMGVTGAAFRRLWNRDDGGNVGILRYENEPFRLGFAALGYRWHTVPADADQETMRAAIRESLAQGRPAISFGIIGPPEPGLVAGYDEGGEVLYGWSYFQDQRERYYELRDWFETMDKSGEVALLIVGQNGQPRPSEREVLVSTLQWALDLARTAERPNLPEHLSGLAAYDGWADGLEVDADYPADDRETMFWRVVIHGDQCVMLDERHEAARFLRRMKVVVPPQAAAHMEEAATLYDRVADLGAPLWPWPIDPKAGAMQALADPGTRRGLAAHVRAARALEEEAVACLERAVEVVG